MLLCKRLYRFKKPTVQTYKAYSTQDVSPYPFRNLRAFPFKRSPDEAQRYIGILAAVLCRDKGLESLAAFLLPGLGFQPIKPVRLAPVWFPGWILDAEVRGEVDIKGNEHQASTQIHNAYVPGSDYKVLSSTPLLPPDAHLRESVPFTEDLLRQFDLDVTCIPFNISPFSILEVACHLSYGEATIAQGFRFSPSSLKPTLVAAYPILVPVYLLQYEFHSPIDSKKHYHTFFIEAYGIDGNVWSEHPSSEHAPGVQMLQKYRGFLGHFDSTQESVINLGYPKRFIELAGFSHVPHQELGNAIRDYLERALDSPGAPTALARASVNEMAGLTEDQRVREFTSEDRKPIIEWLQLGAELMMVQRIHEAMSQARSGGSVHVYGTGTKKADKGTLVDGARQHLIEKSKTLKAERLRVKPMWAKTEEDLVEELQAKAEAERSAGSQNKEGSDSTKSP